MTAGDVSVDDPAYTHCDEVDDVQEFVVHATNPTFIVSVMSSKPKLSPETVTSGLSDENPQPVIGGAL